MGVHIRQADGDAVLHVQPHSRSHPIRTLVVQTDTDRAMHFDLNKVERAMLAAALADPGPATGCEHAGCTDADGHWDGCMEVDRERRNDERQNAAEEE